MVREDRELFDVLLDLVERLQPHIFIALPVRDVPADDLDADHPAAIHDRGFIHLDGGGRPVLPADLHQQPLDRLSPGDPGIGLQPVGAAFLEDIITALHPDHLFRGITEDPRYGRGDVGDPPVSVAGIDHIETSLGDLPEPLLALPERVLHLPPVGDVFHHPDDEPFLFRIAERRCGQPAPDDPAVFCHVALLPAGALP